MFGKWTVSVEEYIDVVGTYWELIGNMDFAAPQDWMCEDVMLEKTGLSVETHQELTVSNYVELKERAPELPFIPVLQGDTIFSYLRCADMYRDAGVDLAAVPTVGVGSVCRRQGTAEIGALMREFASRGYRLHGFGVKTLGLKRYASHLQSADSLAWSFRARRSEPLPGCSHKSCANCQLFALKWREKVLGSFNSSPTLLAA